MKPRKPDKAPAIPAPEAAARGAGLSRWEGEGGTGPVAAPAPRPCAGCSEPLRQRVIALENLVIALLAGASDGQRTQAEAMADFISPRPGRTAHPLTLRAAGTMRSLLRRSGRFRAPPSGRGRG